jgi:hypothetical protein
MEAEIRSTYPRLMESFVAPVQSNEPGMPAGHYRSTRALTIATLALLAVQAGVSALLMFSWPSLNHFSTDGLLDSLRVLALGIAWLVQDGLLIGTAIVFLFWLHASFVNLRALGSLSLSMSPKDAVVGWLIPFVNLVHGWKSVHVLYVESRDPEPAIGKRAPLVGAWWASYLVGSLAGVIGNRGLTRDPAGAIKWMVAKEALRVVAAVLCILIVRRIDRWQARMGRYSADGRVEA